MKRKSSNGRVFCAAGGYSLAMLALQAALLFSRGDALFDSIMGNAFFGVAWMLAPCAPWLWVFLTAGKGAR